MRVPEFIPDSIYVFFFLKMFLLISCTKNTIQDFLCRLHSSIKYHLMLLERRWVERKAFSSSHSLRSAAILSWSQGLWIFFQSFLCLCLCLSLYAVTFLSVSLLLPVSVFPLVNCSYVLLFLSLHWYMSCSLISALCMHSNCPLC